jgi:hypothetical protein
MLKSQSHQKHISILILFNEQNINFFKNYYINLFNFKIY